MTLPELNAGLNVASVFFLSSGYFFIKRKNILRHKISMLAAFSSSAVFLSGYLYYHARHGAIHFLGTGWVRYFYFVLLSVHTSLAMIIVPLVITVLFHALNKNFDRHKAWARITWPIWMTVSLTGVAVYIFLFHFQ